jgi:protein TonB
VVLVLVRVAEDGIPLDVALKESSGHPMLDEAAIEAVRHWRFTPARQSGRAVTAAVEVPVRFSLEG